MLLVFLFAIFVHATRQIVFHSTVNHTLHVNHLSKFMWTCGGQPQLLIEMDINSMWRLWMNTCVSHGSFLSITKVISSNSLCDFVKWLNNFFHLISSACGVSGEFTINFFVKFLADKRIQWNCCVCTQRNKMVSRNISTVKLAMLGVVYYIRLTFHSISNVMRTRVPSSLLIASRRQQQAMWVHKSYFINVRLIWWFYKHLACDASHSFLVNIATSCRVWPHQAYSLLTSTSTEDPSVSIFSLVQSSSLGMSCSMKMFFLIQFTNDLLLTKSYQTHTTSILCHMSQPPLLLPLQHPHRLQHMPPT